MVVVVVNRTGGGLHGVLGALLLHFRLLLVHHDGVRTERLLELGRRLHWSRLIDHRVLVGWLLVLLMLVLHVDLSVEGRGRLHELLLRRMRHVLCVFVDIRICLIGVESIVGVRLLLVHFCASSTFGAVNLSLTICALAAQEL